MGCALLAACDEGELPTIEVLLDELGPHYASPWGRTPLIACAANGHTLAAACVLGRGAELDATDADGRTPL
eukprot:1246719-Prymnesium_polylepis.1